MRKSEFSRKGTTFYENVDSQWPMEWLVFEQSPFLSGQSSLNLFNLVENAYKINTF